jgi:hypothetical protein
LKILSLLACVLHFTAVFLTASVGLCVGNDGHACYEWEDDACCGEPAVIVERAPVAPVPECCQECEPAPIGPVEPLPVLSAAPDCGGCLDTLAPLMSGMHVVLNQVAPPPAETGGFFLELTFANDSEVPFGTAPGGPPIRMPLRC